VPYAEPALPSITQPHLDNEQLEPLEPAEKMTKPVVVEKPLEVEKMVLV
jgi:hypothetical protein